MELTIEAARAICRRVMRQGAARRRGRWVRPSTKVCTDMAASDIRALVTYLRSVPPIASPDLPAKLAPPAPDSPKAGKRDGGRAWQARVRRRLRALS